MQNPKGMAHRNDPATSHEAAQNLIISGKRVTQTKAVEAAVHEHPGLTSAELADAAGIQRHATARRLPELRARGAVHQGVTRTCRANGTAAVTWWPEPQSAPAPPPQRPAKAPERGTVDREYRSAANDPQRVPPAVLGALMAAEREGVTLAARRETVRHLRANGQHATADWIEGHVGRYTHGVLFGFRAGPGFEP